MKNILITCLAALFSTAVFAQTQVRQQTQEETLNEKFCTGLFKSAHGTLIDMSKEQSAISYFNILDWLEGRVAGLQVFTTRSGTRVPVIRGQQPAIFIDEFQVNAGYLTSLPVSEIALIKVIKTPFAGGFNASGGAIVIYTAPEEEEEETEEGK
jgi:hypothetical protein